MLDETFTKLETKIRQSEAIQAAQKSELLGLLPPLHSAVAELAKTHTEHAESVVGFADISTHEVTRQHRNPQLAALALKGFTSSVQELEASHPTLVQIVNAMSVILSNIGI